MKRDAEKAEMENLLKRIECHPLTQKIREEENLKILEQRLITATKLRALGEEAEAVIPERETELAKLPVALQSGRLSDFSCNPCKN